MKKDSMEVRPAAHLNIDRLLDRLEALSKQDERFTRAKIDEIFRALRFEISFTSPVVNAALAAALYADSPQKNTNTALNDVVIQLAKALINPTQIEVLSEGVQTYLAARKNTEKEYAAASIIPVIAAHPMEAFPTVVWPFLNDLTITVMEKIIHEKQSRRIPGYKSQSVMDLIRPFLNYRLANPQLEKVKQEQPQNFKQWVLAIAHEGYDSINDEIKFRAIQHEKETAFDNFKKFVTMKTLNKAALSRYLEKIRFSQTDINKKMDKLNHHLNEFLSVKSVLSKSSAELRGRFNEKLRKLFAATDKSQGAYQSEDIITEAHNNAFKEVESDLQAIKKIILVVTGIEVNYLKSLMTSLLARSNVTRMNDLLLDVLLGGYVKKRDMATGSLIEVRDGGYPSQNMQDIYSNLIQQLEHFQNKSSGLFSASLKKLITAATHELSTAQSQLPEPVKITFRAPPISETAAENRIASKPAETVIEKPEIIPPQKAAVTAPIPEPEILQTPASSATPTAPEPDTAPELEEETDADFSLETPMLHEAEDVDFSTQDAVPAEEETDFGFSLEPVAKNEKPELPGAETKFSLEPVAENKTATANENNMPENLAEPALELEPVKAAEQHTAPVDPGLAIMQGYQLGELKDPVYEAWQVMLVQAVQANTTAEKDLHAIAAEQEANFHVICDLVQTVVSIPEAPLTPDHKEMLQSITTLLLAALKDPLEENNWTFFEGGRRNDVDRAIAILKSA
jgi:hypothetical protein